MKPQWTDEQMKARGELAKVSRASQAAAMYRLLLRGVDVRQYAPADGEARLLFAIIREAFVDLTHGDSKNVVRAREFDDAVEFFRDGRLEAITELLGVDSGWIRPAVEKWIESLYPQREAAA